MQAFQLPTETHTIGGHTICLVSHPTVWMPTFFGLKLVELLIKYLPSGARILELGAGSGITAIAAAKAGAAQITTLDFNPEAVALVPEQWKLNGLPDSILDVRQSNLWSALTRADIGQYDAVVSNPPTFPIFLNGEPRNARNDWEAAGENGRLVLDAVIQGTKWIKPGGIGLFIATSTQSMRQTKKMLKTQWSSWEILEEHEIPLADHYRQFIPFWRQRGQRLSETLIHHRNGQWYQRLYFIKSFR